jgi:Zn-dependent M28 family amino/carboxypeptidase
MKRFVLLAAGAALVGAGALAAANGPIDAAKLKADIKVVSSDAFEGRGPATPGETKTVGWLVAQYKAMGLQPGGDKLKGGGRSWTQAVPLEEFETEGPVRVSVKTGADTLTWSQGEEVALRAAQTGQTSVDIKNAPVVFVGYGVSAPERNWDDYKGVDLRGKIALMLVNDPDYETGVGDFGGKAMTYYGRWTYKYEEGARRHALGVLVIHETGPASYGWPTVKNSNINAVFDIVRKDPAEAHVPLEGWIQRDQTVALFKAAGLNFDALKQLAQTRDFKPVNLTNVSFSTDFKVKAQKVVSHNVVALKPGSTHANEYVIYSAHWDHLGIGPADARGDKIYNGAIDNGTGTAALVEIARAYAKAPAPQRSVLFMNVTAEEKGLLGSEYYAANPVYPLAKTVANINMDVLSPGAGEHDVTARGNGGLTLQDDLIKVAKEHGRYFTPDPRPEAGGFFRSDHFSFAKRGVPALSIGSGVDFIEGGKPAGLKAGEEYNTRHYHQPSDEFDPAWNTAGMAADADLLYDLGRQLATSREWPVWKEGSEFKAARDKTEAQRK